MPSGSVFTHRPKLILSSAVAAALILALAAPVSATHFRFGHLNWQPRTDIHPNAVEFTVVVSARRSAFQCLTHPGQCSEGSPDSYPEPERPQVGDTVVEDLGGTTLCFGDGNCTPVLEFDVTAIDLTSDWFFGELTVAHTYATAGTFTAFSDDCCRISSCSAINAHINNPDDDYRMETIVDVGTGNSSPVSSMPPIVVCGQNGICSFTIPGVDDGGAIDFRLSTPAEAGFTRQPGPPDCPNTPSLDVNTGLFTWDTNGCTLGSDVCGAGFTTLYSMQATLDDGVSKSAVDFFIQLGQSTGCSGNSPPVFDGPTPACGSTIAASVAENVAFTVQATDPDSGDTVDLNCVGAPPGSSFVPTLPTNGSPTASSAFSWTPGAADTGFHTLTCTADDVCDQRLCSITLAVNDCGNGALENGEQCDDGNTADGDCCSAGCQFEAAGSACADDGNECTLDTCDGAGECTNVAVASGTPCGDPTNTECGAPDSCDGSGLCMTNDEPFGMACGDPSSTDCTMPDSCDGAGSCIANHFPDETSCDDLDFCTLSGVCSGGVCGGGDAVACADDGDLCTHDFCDSNTAACVHVVEPKPFCHDAGLGQIVVTNKEDDTKDKLKWKWVRGLPVDFLNLGDPTANTEFELCLYDMEPNNVPVLRSRLLIPPSSTWRVLGNQKGYKYKDKTRSIGGTKLVKLKTGEKPKFGLKAERENLNTPEPVIPAGGGSKGQYFYVDPMFNAQLMSSTGECWTADFDTVKKNTGQKFKSRRRGVVIK